MRALAVGALLLVASTAHAHNRSEGRARFAIDATGRVAVGITLSELDMPELCDLDLSHSDPAVRADRIAKLDVCISTKLPRLLLVRADGVPCPVVVAKTGAGNRTVTIEAAASCKALPRTLVVDWGLFAGTPLDHVAVGTIEQPHAEPRLVMLSKRNAKITVDVARPLWPKLVGAALAVVVVAGALGWALRRRRRARSGERSG